MSDLRVVLKGKGEEFSKNPKKVMTELGLLKEGEDITPEAKGGSEPERVKGGVHLHTIVGEVEAF